MTRNRYFKTAAYTILFIITAILFLIVFIKRSDSSVTQRYYKNTNNSCVILIHGILRTSNSMNDISKILSSKGFCVINFGYKSRKDSFEITAEKLHREIKNLPDNINSLNFVTHSMGALIARYYIDLYKPKNLKRIVMIAPPNRGSAWGKLLYKNFSLMRWIMGAAGAELAGGIEKTLGIPRCEFGIIAGGLNNNRGFNPFIPGDDDMTVAVSETPLEGMKDYILIEGQHSALLYQKIVIENIIHFLKNGIFIK